MRPLYLLAATVFVAVFTISCPRVFALSTVATLPPGFAPFGTPESVVSGTTTVYVDPWTPNATNVRVDSASGQDRPWVRYAGGLVHLAASKDLVAVQAPPQAGIVDLSVGPPGGQLSLLSHCTGRSANTAPTGASVYAMGSGFAVDGSNVAYVDDGCGAPGSPLRLMVASHAASGPRPVSFAVPADAQVSDVTLAGPYLAYHLQTRQGGEIVEDNWQTGAERLRVADGGSQPCATTGPANQMVDEFCGLGLQADGKLARVLGSFDFYPGRPGPQEDPANQPDNRDFCRGSVAWTDPASPTWHTVASNACGTDWASSTGFSPVAAVPLMAGDRIVYPYTNFGGHAVASLDGPLKSLGDTGAIFGFDGRRALVYQTSCSAITLEALDVAQDSPVHYVPEYLMRCPVRFARAHIVLGPHPRFTVVLRCPHGCHGPLVIGTQAVVETSSSSFALAPGGRLRIVIPLSARGAIVRAARDARKHHRAATVLIDTLAVGVYDPHLSPEKNVAHTSPPYDVTTRVRARLVTGR
jgi:hypothetical protein